MPLKTTTDEAIDKLREATARHAEAVRAVDLSRRRLDSDTQRMHDAGNALAQAHRALLLAIGPTPDDA